MSQSIKQVLRLKGLLVLVILVALGGWWTLDDHLKPAFENLRADLLYYWDNATLAALMRAVAMYFSRFGWRVIAVEVVKRILIWLAINRLIIWLIPWETRLKWRWMIQEKREGLADKIKKARDYLGSDDMFGPYFGWAVWIIMTGVVLVLFYSFFWLWTMIVLGFIKLPGMINRLFSSLRKLMAKVAEKTGLRKFVIKLFKLATRNIWAPLTKYLPNWSFLVQDEEKERQKRVKRIRQVRTLIRMRRNKELWWQARGNLHKYRELRDKQGHRITLSLWPFRRSVGDIKKEKPSSQVSE